MKKLPAKHLIGVEFFRFPNLESLDANEYFDCLDLLRPLFRNSDFKNSTPGFYINYITNEEKDGDDGKNSVRLTYFSTNIVKTNRAIEDFVEMNSEKISIYEFKNRTRPVAKEKKIKSCSPELLRFRKFLNTYTQIGLDLLENFGRLCTRRLVATYRLNYFPLPSPRSFFEPVFNKHSEFFRQLNKSYSAQQLWEDLERVESRKVWMHFLVNMLLPNDFNRYGIPITEEVKRGLLSVIKLDIPDGWELGCNL